MPSYNGVSATINVDGQALPEYQVQVNEATKEVTCWIPSQPDKEFTVFLHNTTRKVRVQVWVDMDGQDTNAEELGPGECEFVDGCCTTSTAYRTFVFSPGQLVDDDNLSPEDLNAASAFGAIKLTVFEGHVVRTSKRPSDNNEKMKIPDKKKIPERAKKGLTECVGFGPIQPARVSSTPRRKSYYVFKRDGLRAKIIIRYRPLGFLQARGIAPSNTAGPSNSRSRTSRKRKVEVIEDNSEDTHGPSKHFAICKFEGPQKEMIKSNITENLTLEELLALRAKTDKEIAKKDPSAARVKREVKQERLPVFLKGEVIDLT